MGFDLGWNLPTGILGLGALSTGLGAYSALNQAQQMNALRGRAQNVADFLANPQAVQAQAEQYYQRNLANVNQAAQNLLQQQIAPLEGMHGYDPRSGQGQLIYAQATAPLYQQAWQQALANVLGGAQGQLSALKGAEPFVTPVYGGVGGLGSAMEQLAWLQALQNANKAGKSTAQDLTMSPTLFKTGLPPPTPSALTWDSSKGWISSEPNFSGGAEF